MRTDLQRAAGCVNLHANDTARLFDEACDFGLRFQMEFGIALRLLRKKFQEVSGGISATKGQRHCSFEV
jgi:hypothetical protein